MSSFHRFSQSVWWLNPSTRVANLAVNDAVAREEAQVEKHNVSSSSRCRKYWAWFNQPRGVRPRHYFIVRWFGRVGFVAKGIVYAVMGGLCIATAQQLRTDITGTESPMGAFIFLGMFSIGTPLLIIMFIGILFYSLWRFWEGFLGQGTDFMRSHFNNFFRYRLSPVVSGLVYVFYLSYIGQLIVETREARVLKATTSNGCFPACWAQSDMAHRMAVGVFGLAFLIASLTQVQNGFSKRWHLDLMMHHCTALEKYTLFTLGHLGFLARGGVFMFVAVFMFKSLHYPTASERDTFSDAINQVISAHGGSVGLWFLGVGLILFGTFAVLNAYYKYFPTPPPSRMGFYDHKKASDPLFSDIQQVIVSAARIDYHSNTERPASPWEMTRRSQRRAKDACAA